MRVSGEILVDIEMGSKKIPHKVFVANIIDPVILGMDFMAHHRVMSDVGQKSMKFDNEELILKTNREKKVGTRQAVLADNILISAKIEMVVAIKLDEGSNGMIEVVERAPTPTNNGILL